jgi:hypothetical protein
MMNEFREEAARLSEDDQRVLDALAAARFEPGAVQAMPPADRRRAEALMGAFGLLHDYPVEDADPALINAALARIDRHEDDRAARLSFEAARAAQSDERRAFRGLRVRVPDFITVAAVLLLASAVLFPVVSRVRQASIDNGCADNMRLLGAAFSQYAGDYGGAVPVAQAGLGGALDWAGRHNILNIRPLLEYGYCQQGHLNCPGHHDEFSSSYSYQWQESGRPVLWNRGVIAMLGDRNPILDAALLGRSLSPMSISINHGGRGQNVLRADGGVLWLAQPIIDRDNIWLPHGFTILREGARPTSTSDAFLAH